MIQTIIEYSEDGTYASFIKGQELTHFHGRFFFTNYDDSVVKLFYHHKTEYGQVISYKKYNLPDARYGWVGHITIND